MYMNVLRAVFLTSVVGMVRAQSCANDADPSSVIKRLDENGVCITFDNKPSICTKPSVLDHDLVTYEYYHVGNDENIMNCANRCKNGADTNGNYEGPCVGFSMWGSTSDTNKYCVVYTLASGDANKVVATWDNPTRSPHGCKQQSGQYIDWQDTPAWNLNLHTIRVPINETHITCPYAFDANSKMCLWRESCDSGYFIDENDSCTALSVCTSTEYESEPPTYTSDRQCTAISAPCAGDMYQSTAATATSDRVCSFNTDYSKRVNDDNTGLVDCPGGQDSSASNGASCAACPSGTERAAGSPIGCQHIYTRTILQGELPTAISQCESSGWGTNGCILNEWDVSQITTMKNLFKGKETFNEDISAWDTSSVTDMSGMFEHARSFNQPIGNWNTSSVTTMMGMFLYAASFDQPLNNWDVSSVEEAIWMFRYATSFNQPLYKWDVRAMYSMSFMFDGATSFDQSISCWDLHPNVQLSAIFRDAPARFRTHFVSRPTGHFYPNSKDPKVSGYIPDVALRDSPNSDCVPCPPNTARGDDGMLCIPTLEYFTDAEILSRWNSRHGTCGS